MCESGFIFFPSILLCTKCLSVPLAAGFTEYNKSHTDSSRGEQDPEEVFFCLPWTEEPPWE